MSPILLLILLSPISISVSSLRFCSEQYEDCIESAYCTNIIGVLGECASAAWNDTEWRCSKPCQQALSSYFDFIEPSWTPDITLESCICDPLNANDTSCEDGRRALADAGCGQQYCIINEEESDTIYVSSIGNDDYISCGAQHCPCGTIGYAFFIATNDITFKDGEYNHFFLSTSITINIDGVNKANLQDKDNKQKCGIHTWYKDSEHSGNVDPMFGIGSLNNKDDITFNFSYVRQHLDYELRITQRQDWFPCGHSYCSPSDDDSYEWCDGLYEDVFRLPQSDWLYKEDASIWDSLHEISIHITGLVWDNIFRKKWSGNLIDSGSDTRTRFVLSNSWINNMFIDTSQKPFIKGQTVEIIDCVFEYIVIFNEAKGDDDIFDSVSADQYLFGDMYFESKSPHIEWAKGFKFINTEFKYITQYDADKRYFVESEERTLYLSMKRVFEVEINVTTQSIEVDLAIISLPMATFAAWMEYSFVDCTFQSISHVDIMRSDPGVMMTTPWNITNTVFKDIYDCAIINAQTRTDTHWQNIYIETSTTRDLTEIEYGLFQFGGQTSNTMINITYNYIFPIRDGVSALNIDILDVTKNVLECLNQPNKETSLNMVRDINYTSCSIIKYPIPLLVNEGDVVIVNLTTVIDWDKQAFIDLIQIKNYADYDDNLKRGIRNILDTETHECLVEQNANCDFYPIIYQYYAFEWFVGANFDVSLIFNGAGASLSIDNWYVDREIHSALIYNTGDVILSDVRTNYYHAFIDSDDGNGIHDPNDLHGQFCFFQSLGTFEIRNSKLFGCGIWTFAVIESEYFIIDDVELRWSAVPITSANLADNLQVTNSKFIDVGIYYASIGYMEQAFSLVQSPPFAIAGTSTYFGNCLFSFYDPVGFIHVPYSIFNRDYTLEHSDPALITIDSSEFIVNPDQSNIVYDTDNILNLTSAFQNDALILLEENTEIEFISNVFEGNPIDETVPLLQINNSITTVKRPDGFTNCMLDNHLTNYALKIIGGKMLPCHLEQIVELVMKTLAVDDENSCMPTLGALNPIYGNNTKSFFMKAEHYSGPLVVIDKDEYSIYASFGLTSGIITSEGDLYPEEEWEPIVLQDGWLVISETNYPESASLMYEDNVCSIYCYKYVNYVWNDIDQLISECPDYSQENEQNIMSLENYASEEAQAAFSFAHVVNLILESYSIYPGGKFIINGLNIKDVYNQDVLDYTTDITTKLLISNSKTAANLDVDIIWSIKEDITYCNVSGRGCYWCSECGDIGLVVQSFTILDLNITDHFDVSVNLVNDTTSLFASSFGLDLSECPSGLGVNSKTLQCEECEEGYFSFYDTRKGCSSCSGYDGISCPGLNEVRIDVDYWFQFENGSLLTGDCPTGYCCQNRGGCDYFGNNTDSALCAVGRDPTKPMCGQCLSGLSEYIGSVDCGECPNPAAASYNIFILILTAVFCWYNVYFSRYRKEYVNQLLAIQRKQDKAKSGSTNTQHSYHFSTFGGYFWDKWRMLRVQLYKPLMYYFQSLSFVLQQGGITVYLLPLLNIFNLSIDIVGTNRSGNVKASGFCLYNELQARGEIAIGFMVPSFLLFELGVCGAGCRHRKCCNKEPAVGIAFWTILLMSMGVIFNTVLKAIACREIDGSFYMFYAGSNLCFDFAWYLHLFFLVLVIFVFIFLFFRLKKYDIKRRQHPNFSMRTFILPYKSMYWYWEFVLLSRRFIVAFIALFPYSSKQYLNMLLLLIFTFYLSLHIWLRPFYHKENNYVEAVCLFCSICVISLLGFLDDEDQVNVDELKASLVTLCILIPLMLFSYYIFTICCYKYQQQNDMSNNMPDNTNEVELITPGFNTLQSVSIGASTDVVIKDKTIDDDIKQEENQTVNQSADSAQDKVVINNDGNDGGATGRTEAVDHQEQQDVIQTVL